MAASGGTEFGGGIDFGTRRQGHFLGVIGRHDVTIVAAPQPDVDAKSGLDSASTRIAVIDSLDRAA